jgi:4-fold beta-flower domain-containing protein
MSLTFFDQSGTPVAYSDDLVHIYLFDGEPVAYLAGGQHVYAYSGEHLGWLHEGWILDHNGNHVFFTERAGGGPIKPLKALKPLKGIKGIRSIKGVRSIPPLKPLRSLSWSDLEGESFFDG